MSWRAWAAGVLALAGMLTLPAQGVGSTFPGSNGKILFAVYSAAAGESGFYTMDSDGQSRTQIAPEFTSDFTPGAEFSADGERIVFARFGPDVELVIMDADGQNQTPLTDNTVHDFQPSFFPNGRRIVFVRSFSGMDDEIFAMDLDGQNLVQLTDNTVSDGEPSVSPDGTRIVFTRTVGSDRDIFVMDADGQNQVPLTNNTVEEGDPSFSPDGQQIAFARDDSPTDREIVVMGADGQNPTPLTNTTVLNSNPVFSPDGRKIAFNRLMGDTEVFLMDADGQNQVQLTDNSVVDFSPSWQPLNPPVLDLSAEPKQKSARFVTVTVSTNEDAAATIAGTLKAPQAPKSKASASKAKTFDLAPVTVELAPGQPATVTLEVPKKGRKTLKRALKAGKKGTASITATATDDLGTSAQDSQQVKIKKKK